MARSPPDQTDAEAITPEGLIARNAIVTAVSVTGSMVLGAILAVLVLHEFGKDAETDGFFAAYGVYALLLTIAQSLRAAVVPRLVEGLSLFANLDRFVGAALLIFLLAGIPFAALGAPLAELLVGDLGDEARDPTREALAILWLASGAHLLAALGAATLAARDEFGAPGLAYVLGGTLAIAVLLALSGELGITAVSIGLAAGSLLSAAIIFSRLGQAGYRPRLSLIIRRAGTLGAAAIMLAGSIGALGLQLMYVVSLAFAARITEGSVTLYSYAFFGAVLLVGATSSTSAIVLAAPLSRTWDRRPESLDPYLLTVFRVGVALVVPIFAVVAVVGDEAGDLVLGGSLDGGDVDTIVVTFLALAGVVLASAAAPVPLLAAFAASRYRAVAVLTALAIGLHLAGSAVALEASSLEVLGAAASISSLLGLALLAALVWGRRFPATLTLLARELGRVVVVAALAFLPLGAPAVLFGGPLAQMAAALVGVAAFAMLLRRLLPEHWGLLLRLVTPLSGGRLAPAPR
jgi:peptidoglycan biosynthesis protein MviN/MurJ (putative lipid II flippase)